VELIKLSMAGDSPPSSQPSLEFTEHMAAFGDPKATKCERLRLESFNNSAGLKTPYRLSPTFKSRRDENRSSNAALSVDHR
jgi:hypothetical protein